MTTTGLLIAAAEALPSSTAPLWGKAAFVAVFVVLLVWLLLLPARFLDQDKVRPPWWRNVRFWAVLVTLAQISVYLYWG